MAWCAVRMRVGPSGVLKHQRSPGRGLSTSVSVRRAQWHGAHVRWAHWGAHAPAVARESGTCAPCAMA
eukprot:7724189-Alexandrium_andersonii.AAC.1